MLDPVSQGPPALLGTDARLLHGEILPHSKVGQSRAFSRPSPSLGTLTPSHCRQSQRLPEVGSDARVLQGDPQRVQEETQLEE